MISIKMDKKNILVVLAVVLLIISFAVLTFYFLDNSNQESGQESTGSNQGNIKLVIEKTPYNTGGGSNG